MSDTTIQDPVRQPLIDLLPLVRTLWKRRLLIVLATLGFIAVGAGYLVVTKPTYTANAIILVDPRQPNTTDADNVLPGIGSDSAAIASQVAVISSRELLTTVFDAEGIEQDPEFAKAGKGSPDSASSRAAIFESFAQKVAVNREGLTYVIDVGFQSQDPDKAARIANAIASHYIAGQIAQKAEANSEVTGLLDERIADLQQDVTDAERKVEAFRIANRIFADTSGATQLQTQTEQLEGQLQAAQEAARQAEAKAAQALAAGRSPQALISLSEVLTSTTAESLRAEYNARSLALSSNQSVFGPRHPTLRRLESELARVENLMVREVERITQELVAQRDVAQGVVDRIRGELSSLRDQGNDANLKLVELRQLERNADASRGVLEQFLKRSAETSQFEQLQFSDARIITAATAPLRATWPKSSLVLAVAAALGLIAGLGTAMLLGEPKAKPAKAPGQPVIGRVLNGLRQRMPRREIRLPAAPAKAARPPAKPAQPAAARPAAPAPAAARPARPVAQKLSPAPASKSAAPSARPSPKAVLAPRKPVAVAPNAPAPRPPARTQDARRTFVDLN